MNSKFYAHLLNKKLGLAVAAGLFFCSSAFTQTVDSYNRCGNDIQKMAAQYPGFLEAYQAFESNWEDFKNNADFRWFEQTATGKYVIPVVVHVLHLGGTDNISATQVKSQITALNTFFAMENPGLEALNPSPPNSFPAFDTVVPYFNGVDSTYVIHGWNHQPYNCRDTAVVLPGHTDTTHITVCDTVIEPDTLYMLNRFEFRLATKDPFGACTDGIVRLYTDKAENAQNETRFKQASNWDRAKYFNIWVIKDFPDPSLLGYAQFPFAFGNQFPLTSTDGIAIIHTAFGTTGTAAGHTGATPTHESGHWLGLFHIWGDADCGSDGIDDTPVHKAPNYSCPCTLPKTATCYVDTATTDSSLNAHNLVLRHQVGEQWMNYMDYTDDSGQWMFSEEQYRKMNVSMETIPFRGGVAEMSNLLATGTDDAAQATKCHAAPIADLWSRDGSNNFVIQKLICAGGDLTYKDGTFNLSNPGSVASTPAWSFPGGTPNTSTVASPVVVYNTPGIYDASLTSTNPDGVNTKNRTGYVVVSATTADEQNILYYDDFEYSTSLYEQGKWININQGVDPANGWEQTTSTGYLSSKSMVMRNDNNIIYEQDFLVSASYDMTVITNEKLYFKYAGARKTTNPNFIQKDQLQVYVSTNCGENWTVRPIKVDGVSRTVLSGDTLYSAGLFSTGFVPTAANQWKQAEVDLNVAPYNNASNLRVMFVWTSGGPNGNDFYIDQFNISNSTDIGIEENNFQADYSVYPNPVTATSQIYFKLNKDSRVKVDVLDIAGRVVKEIYSGELQSGEQFMSINNADFNSAGIYMVRLTVDGVVSTKKVIIE